MYKCHATLNTLNIIFAEELCLNKVQNSMNMFISMR